MDFPTSENPLRSWEALLFVSTLASFISGLLDALVFVSP